MSLEGEDAGVASPGEGLWMRGFALPPLVVGLHGPQSGTDCTTSMAPKGLSGGRRRWEGTG